MQMMTPGSLIHQQNQFLMQQQANGRKTQLQTIQVSENTGSQHGQAKGSRQSSKMRKNVPSAMRNQ